MIIVYFDQKPNLSAYNNIKQLLHEKSEVTYFASPDISLNSLPVSAQHFQLDYDIQRIINHETLNSILNFPDKLISEKKVRDWYNIHGIDSWYYFKSRTYFRLRNLFYKEAIIDEFSKHYSKVIFVTNDKYVEYFKNNNKKLDVLHLKSEKVININTLFSYTFFLLIRTLIYLFKKHSLKKHILIDKAEPVNYLGLDLKKKKGNYIIGYLIENIPDDFLVIQERPFPKLNKNSRYKINLKDLFIDKNILPVEGIVLSGYFRKKIRSQVSRDYSQLKNQLSEVKKNTTNQTDEFIISITMDFLASAKVFLAKYYSFIRFFKKNNSFLTISAIDENNPITKCVFDAARVNNIITIGIQHGAIHQLLPAYIISQNEAKNKVTPDFTMIWGDATRQMLTHKSYFSTESLITIGQIRTDIIPLMKQDKLKDLIPSYLHDKSVIMFASQPQRDPVMRYRAAQDVFNACKNINSVHLVLKPHPLEKNDSDYYRNIAKEAGCTNYTIEQELDLYSLLAISEIVVTCFSTVGAEAIYFEKPLIIIDPLKQDLQNYHAFGVAFQVTQSIDLNDIIVKLLSKKIHIDKISYKDFIENHAYKIDGKTGERFFKFIRSLET